MKYMHLQTSYDFTEIGDEALVMSFRSLAANIQAVKFLKMRESKVTRAKYNAVIDELVQLNKLGRPALVGTTTVEVSELLSKMLHIRKIPHNVLNARLHQREAEVVAQADSKQIVISRIMNFICLSLILIHSQKVPLNQGLPLQYPRFPAPFVICPHLL